MTIDTTAPVTPSITSFSPDSGMVGDDITNADTSDADRHGGSQLDGQGL